MLSIIIQIEDFTARLAINSSAKHNRELIRRGSGEYAVKVSFLWSFFRSDCNLFMSTTAQFIGRPSSFSDERRHGMGGLQRWSWSSNPRICEKGVIGGDLIEIALQQSSDGHVTVLFNPFRSKSSNISDGKESTGRYEAVEHHWFSVSIGTSSDRK